MQKKNSRRWGVYAVLGVVLAGSSIARADDAPAQPAPDQPAPAQPAPAPKQKRPNLRQRIMTELDLTADQKAQVEPLLKTYMDKSKEIRKNETLDKKQKREQTRALAEELQKQLEPIMTEQQKPKLADIFSQMTARRGRKKQQ